MLRNKLKLLDSQLGENRLQIGIDISGYLESKKASQVAAFYICTTQQELIEIMGLVKELEIPYILIGSGTKSMIEDNYQGIVIKNRSHSIRIFGIKGKVSKGGLKLTSAFIEADSGVSMISLIEFINKQKLTGLDSLREIPGTLGGNFFINLQIQEKSDHVKVISKKDTIEQKSSLEIKRDDTIISVTFKLKAKDVN